MILAAFGIAGAAVAIGCSSATPDSTGSSNEALGTQGVGQSCLFGGGPKCAPGLTCVSTGIDNGVCEPTTCGVVLPVKCSSGFYCDLTGVDTGKCVQNNKCDDAEDCKGPLPQLCERCSDGTFQCAHHVCKPGVGGGTCGIEICPPPAPPQCTTAADCHGILPQICELCSDGTSACAHWACEAGKCVDQICPAQ